MIDDLTNEDLQDPTKLRLVIKDVDRNLRNLKRKLDEIDRTLNDDEKGLKNVLKDVIDDVEKIDDKLEEILESQKDTRKTVKNILLSGSIGTAVTSIFGFVLKQLGIW
ncbi:hypothetical protein [Mammaliicoccus vitulinus]|uniref:Hemolysin XhlA n=1 Tax=Mammaliicoccus vitulinus TaxID=71237 RepID=A0ABX7HER4_9STAP|nr:hypothetical protein [Mammaliicoccus vitulinus]PNZ38987.1 hypothetical protein CD107_05795 [Mammaliicoccus vitulinus]QRO85115.1 hypothetical protein I6J37_13215 [Mammaliicoccus vitulinus]